MVTLPISATAPTVDAIYRAYEAHHANEPERTYLGMSVLGDECERKLWYGFRWAFEPERFDGRMLRLFQSGHREEARIIDDLKAIGVTFVELPDGEQHAVDFAGGHGGGHLDGIISGGVPEAPKAEHVFEAKTHNSKSYAKLLSSGVAVAKPMHWAQMQGYMHLTQIDRAFYVAVEKDTDSLYVERVKRDPVAGARLMAKAERIVDAPEPPAKLHDNHESKAAFACRFCPRLEGCHLGAWPRRHCRTCLHATPRQDGAGTWWCDRHGRALSTDDQRSGCGAHLFIPALVPGRQVDADPEAETVTYELAVGGTWVDGQGRAA
jgi:hypothetical protein